MPPPTRNHPASNILARLREARYSALELFAQHSEEESLVSLLLDGPMQGVSADLAAQFARFSEQVEREDTTRAKILVFGGGTGLATIVGGDSRREDWPQRPFTGLKQLFADLHCVVCVTDDGGSTGELRKVLPLVALGDLRHVLLAAIRRDALIRRYGLNEAGAYRTALALHAIFNHRFTRTPERPDQLLREAGLLPHTLPGPLRELARELCETLFTDPRLRPCLDFPQCLGNLLLAAAIYRELDPALSARDLPGRPDALREATIRGLAALAQALGAEEDTVLPASLTPAELSLKYINGVLVTSEDKSASARRDYPVDQIFTAFCGEPLPHPRLPALIEQADILLFAPGSLYTSIMPILQIPGVAGAIRANTHALKLLVANIWVQKGETDATRDAPERKFYVSDLISAYQRNIPGGVEGLFSHVLALNMADIPGSVLQEYALEAKEPIVVDRERVQKMGYGLIEAAVFSRDLLQRQKRIQHDPDALAKTVKTLWMLRRLGLLKPPAVRRAVPGVPPPASIGRKGARPLPCLRWAAMRERLSALGVGHIRTKEQAEHKKPDPLPANRRGDLLRTLSAVLWRHPDILLEHLAAPQKLWLVDTGVWESHEESVENVVSSYEPEGRIILIRDDQCRNPRLLESAFLSALGQSVLGNYAAEKMVEPVRFQGSPVGVIYRLRVREETLLRSFLSYRDIGRYLELSRMHPSPREPGVFTRTVNLHEGFTPPGLYFGLVYAWYLDNQLAPNIEYKMSIMRGMKNEMIPEQIKIRGRRARTIDFFREKVFRLDAPAGGAEKK